MLVTLQRFHLDLHALFQLRQILVLAFLIFRLIVQHRKALELYRRTGCLKDAVVRLDVHGYGIQQGICHLAGNEALPDQLIQLVLIGRQARLDPCRCQAGHRGTDCLVGILRIFLGFVDTGLLRQVFLTVLLHHIVRSCLLCFR